MSDSNQDAELTREALRLCDRYVQEIVLGFGLCPWAEPALRAGRVGRAVCLEAAPAPADCLPFFDRFGDGDRFGDRFAATAAPAIDIGLLIFPRFSGGGSAFDAFAERVRRADRQRHLPSASGAGPTFLVAAFHPDGAQAFTGPHQMVSFLRRTPDPLLQLVRAEIIDRVKENQPTASEDVARRNHDALVGAADGVARLDGLARAIRADRDATYARIGAGA